MTFLSGESGRVCPLLFFKFSIVLQVQERTMQKIEEQPQKGSAFL